jgi:hypothetical protein
LLRLDPWLLRPDTEHRPQHEPCHSHTETMTHESLRTVRSILKLGGSLQLSPSAGRGKSGEIL